MNKRHLSAAPSENSASQFLHLARLAFSFLKDLGFSETESSTSHLILRKGAVDVDIYRGRRSYEINVGISFHGDCYSISEIVKAANSAAGDKFRVRSAHNPDEMAAALGEISDLLQAHGNRALNDDPEFLALLAAQRRRWAENLELDVLARQIRPRAEDAFRSGNYSDAANLYGRIKSRLTPLEERKRLLAELRAKQQ